MGLFGKKEFTLKSDSAFETIRSCRDSEGVFDINKLMRLVLQAENELHAREYEANRKVYGSQMKLHAQELRMVLNWILANPGRTFKYRIG